MRILACAFLFSLSAHAAESDLFQDLFAAPKRPGNNRISYEAQHYGREKVRGTPHTLGLNKQRFRASHTLRDEPSFLNMEVSAEVDQPSTHASFPQSAHPLPRQLWNVGLSSNYRKPLEGDRSIGIGASISSPSDRPFASAREAALTVNATYRVAVGKARDQWLFFLNESNTRGFLPWIPLPGFGYFFDRRDDFKFFLGAPVLGFYWRPATKLMITGFYFPVQSGALEANYFLFGPARINLGFRSGQDVFLPSYRSDKRDRLYALERDVHAGLTMPVNRFLLVDLVGRYTFGRYYYEGKGFSDRKTGPRLDLDPSLGASIKLVSLF